MRRTGSRQPKGLPGHSGSPNRSASRVSPSSVVHYHLRVTYDRMIQETMRRLRQQGQITEPVLDELEERWRRHLESSFNTPELQTVTSSARRLKRSIDTLGVAPIDAKKLRADPVTDFKRGSQLDLASFDEDEIRRKLQATRANRPPLYTTLSFQQPKKKEPEVLEDAPPEEPVVEKKDDGSDSESDEYDGLLEDGAMVEVGCDDMSEYKDKKDNDNQNKASSSSKDFVEVVDEIESDEEDSDDEEAKEKKKNAKKPDVLPELSPLEDVADAEAGSALGSDLDSDAFSEPEIEDHIFASKVEIRSRKNGVWKVKLHNGVCKINKEETLFKQADCTLNFSDWVEADFLG